MSLDFLDYADFFAREFMDVRSKFAALAVFLNESSFWTAYLSGWVLLSYTVEIVIIYLYMVYLGRADVQDVLR